MKRYTATFADDDECYFGASCDGEALEIAHNEADTWNVRLVRVLGDGGRALLPPDGSKQDRAVVFINAVMGVMAPDTSFFVYYRGERDRHLMRQFSAEDVAGAVEFIYSLTDATFRSVYIH